MEHRPYTPNLNIPNDGDFSGNKCETEPAADVAQEKLFKEKQMGGPVNCTHSELCTFLQALEEGFLPTSCLDTDQCVQLKTMSIASKFWQHGNKTGVFHGFQSLEMSRFSTADHGEGTSMSSAGDFPARTSVLQVKAQASPGSEAGCGVRWRELSVRYDQTASSWKTHQCLWNEVLPLSSLTLPRWGMMQNGVLWEREILEESISVTDFGVWQPLFKLPTPCHGTDRWRGTFQEVGGSQNPLRGTWLGRQRVNPGFWEDVMDWPIGWTALDELGTAKFQAWRRSHGGF